MIRSALRPGADRGGTGGRLPESPAAPRADLELLSTRVAVPAVRAEVARAEAVQRSRLESRLRDGAERKLLSARVASGKTTLAA